MEEEKYMQGVLVRGVGSFYTVADPAGRYYTLRCKKKFRHLHLSPLPGDEVLFVPGEGESNGWLEEIFPRRTLCIRPPAANVTRMIIVLAPVPAPDFLLVDRLLAQAVSQKMDAVIVVNKSEIDSTLEERVRREYASCGFRVIAVSAMTGEGIAALQEAMEGELCCFAGQSGVGKSSLINCLLGIERETGALSEKIARGKNTTRHAELLMGKGLRIMDTAGFSLLENEAGLAPEKLKEYWLEFHPYEGKCRFDSCLHDREPGCAVTRAAEEGQVSQERLERYRTLLAEVRQSWKERYH